MNRPILLTLALTLGCTSTPEADDEAGTTTSPSTTDADADVTTSDDDSIDTSSSSSDEDGVPFLPGFDVLVPIYCDPFTQDCPEGEKCVPYSTDGGGVWNSLKCVPIQGDRATGDPCTYDGVEASTDDCDATSWCWNVDENGEGICHSFCTGTPDMPVCPPMSQCTISGSGVITICIATCDPTLQNCPDGTACYWTNFDFNCVATTQDIPTGEPCGFVNDCAMGNMCVDAESVPCNGASCCASFCDIDLGNAQCSDAPGTVCTSFFEQGEAPPEYAHVGICLLPP